MKKVVVSGVFGPDSSGFRFGCRDGFYRRFLEEFTVKGSRERNAWAAMARASHRQGRAVFLHLGE